MQVSASQQGWFGDLSLKGFAVDWIHMLIYSCVFQSVEGNGAPHTGRLQSRPGKILLIWN